MMSIRLINLGILLIAFLTVVLMMKPFIRKSIKKGFVVADMYKKDKPLIPNMGGLVILMGVVISLIVAEFFTRLIVPMLIFYFVVFMFALYGLTDDLFSFKGKMYKVWVLFILALPIAIITKDTNLNLIFFNLELGWAYAFIFAPLYIMIVANMINMHAGYNGLSGGLVLIILAFAAFKSYLTNNSQFVYLIAPIFGSLLAFMYYNKYPSKVFLGNVGSFLIGSALGAYLVLSDIELFGVVILIPHIINFLMWMYWTRIMHREPHVKFAKVKRNGIIEPPNGLTIKYLVTKWFKVTEPQAVYICYALTAVFGVLGLMIV
ncbi:MAG: hypothetical protein KJ583_03175 [Nanoarchaeota archaeon]|nr:hypothetical protein [Nanoarchaeota archaeon]MBU1604296.1 hypothetical protein [Nanoarchaeota archaeon]MBU2442849.1 hypothetical protein [Nanoarchaeota archaeon]